jgi:hypothetical protein
MENLKFEWDANVNVEGKTEETDDSSLIISGELVNGDVCANKFALDISELPNLPNQVKDLTLRADHGKSIRDVIGGFRVSKYDPDKKRVMFEAEVDDPIIQRSILKGRLKYISIGATADSYCSKCGKPSKPFRICNCKNAHDVVKNIKLKEASIVTEPAYQNSEFHPGFLASITSALAENTVMSSQDKPLENKNMEEKREMSEDLNATTLRPAGDKSVVLLGERFQKMEAAMQKMEERFRKMDEDEAKKKEEDERKKDEDEAKKKEEALVSKFESILSGFSTKLDEALKVKLKDEDEAKKEEDEDECKKDEDEDEDEAKKKEEDEDEDEAKKKEHPSGPIPKPPGLPKGRGGSAVGKVPSWKNVPSGKGIPGDIKRDQPPDGGAAPCPDGDGKGPAKPVKKEGALTEAAEQVDNSVTGDEVPAWYKELKAFAAKTWPDEFLA